MDVTTFQCPHCQAVLRMRGKQLADSTFQCPDCNQLLQFSQTAEGSISIKVMDAPPANKAAPQISQKTLWLNSLRRWSSNLAASPVLISWIVAGTGALLILLLMIRDQYSYEKIASQKQTTKVVETPESIPEQPETPAPADTQQLQLIIPAAPEPGPIVRAKPVDPPQVTQALIAVKPEHIPSLEAKKPQPAGRLVAPETDVTIALQIPIVEFRQPEAIPLKKLIRQLEEMLDTKFHVAENIKSDSRLMDTPVSFSLKNTTLANLLKQILSKAALTFTVKSNKIYIQRTEAL